MNRRRFFVAAVGAASLTLPPELLPELFAEAVNVQPNQTAVGDSGQFWDAFFDDVDPSKPHVVMRDSKQSIPQQVDPAKLPRYFHYENAKGLRFAEKIDDSELPQIAGSALVSVSLSGFHPSRADATKMGESSIAQLQLHAVQTTPIAEFIAPLAWASLASVFYSKAGKLPTVEELNFLPDDNSGGASTSISRVLYPKGEGKFAINVTLPPRNSLLHKILTNALKAAQIAAPLVSLPAISVPAIRAFTSFYNDLQQNAGFLLNSPLKDAIASVEALKSPNMHADALKLINGQYVIIADKSTDTFSQQMGNFQINSGYLVPKDLAANQDPIEAAKTALTDITYATIKVTVQQAISQVTAETPSGAPADSSGDGSASGGTSKKPQTNKNGGKP